MRGRFTFIAAVLTIAVLVGWAVNEVTSEESTLQRNAGDVTLIQCEAGSRANVSRVPPSIGRVTCGPIPTSAATASATPTSVATSTATSAPTSTPSALSPTATPSSTPTPTATATTTTGTDICTNNPDCGTPRFFCQTWTGGFCNDYETTVGPVEWETPFDLVANEVSFDCLDATDPNYEPQMLGGTLPFPCVFGKKSHFMSRLESGSFGLGVMRFHRPVDLTSERHIHLEADLKPQNTRNYFRVMLSPDLTKRDPDDRGGEVFPRSFIQAWFRNGKVEGSICRNGVCDGDSYPWGDAFASNWPPMPMADNVRVPIDIYLSQTSIKVYISGELKVNDTFAPLGFDIAYLYLSQVSYNPCKDGNCAPADQIAHWDNVAVDGPTLEANSLTPRGWRDVVFNAYSATGCQVNGTAAVPMGPAKGFTWVTWVGRLPDDGAALAISCQYNYTAWGSEVVRGVEVVKP